MATKMTYSCGVLTLLLGALTLALEALTEAFLSAHTAFSPGISQAFFLHGRSSKSPSERLPRSSPVGQPILGAAIQIVHGV